MMKFAFLSLLAASHATTTALECQQHGPILPRPLDLNHSKTFRRALDNLTSVLDSAVAGRIKAGWDTRNTSISVGLVSLDQAKPSVPLWEFHHLAKGNVNGTKRLDRNSQYLIGSVSKVISDAILLRSGVNIDEPVTKFLPSLNNASSLISWNNITLRALASQLAGIPPNYGFSEYFYLKSYFQTLGFPPIDDSEFGSCGIIGLPYGPCTQDQILQGMLTLHPIAPPMSRPVYSNIAYTLFTYALSARTGKNYTQLVQDLISTPFNMPNTFPSVSPFPAAMDSSRAVIPPVDNSWGSNYADNAPGGGLVSTLADLSSFLHAILSHTVLDTETKVREWLQPRSFAGSRNSFVGTPWEIFRPAPELLFPADVIAQGGGHTVTILEKGGAAYGYNAYISVLDEYGVGVVILTAGDTNAVLGVHDAVLSVLVPAVDAAARESARKEYAGRFLGKTTPATGNMPVNATIEIDAKSMRLVGLSSNGTDMLASFAEVWAVTMGMVMPGTGLGGEWRLYPAEISTPGRLADGKKVVREDWRIMWALESEFESELPGRGISEQNCLSWTAADWVYWGGEPIDRFVFVKDAKDGRVLGLEVPFLRTEVMKKAR